jgi:ATP synthase protein I
MAGDDPRLEGLEDRLKAARKEFDEDYNPPDISEKEMSDSSRVGYEFLAHVIAGGLIGYGIDKLFDTMPWGIMFMIIMGFVSGIYRANKVMKKNNK